MQITLKCPQDGVVVTLELPSDAGALADLWSKSIMVECPMCGGSHIVPFRAAYVSDMMNQFECIPDDVRQGRMH